MLGDDCRDAIDIQPSIHADASMYIVGEDAHGATR
jgi:hypothetical protein